MSRTIAFERNLGELKKEARMLLHHLRQGDVEAAKEYYLLDPEAGTFQTRLADAQYAVARKHGCKSWRDLRKRLTHKAS